LHRRTLGEDFLKKVLPQTPSQKLCIKVFEEGYGEKLFSKSFSPSFFLL